MNRQAGYGLLVSCALALGACEDNAVIGDESCPPEVLSCTQQALSVAGAIVDVATARSTTLTASWSKSNELGLDAAPYSAFASGPDGGLWLFSSDRTTIRARQLDAQGNLVGEQTVAAPADLVSVPVANILIGMAATSHEQGPVLTVQWNKRCPAMNDFPDEDFLCRRNEALVFGRSFATLATRIGGLDNDNISSLPAIYRSAAGDTLWVNRLPTDVLLVDLSGKALWRKELPDKLLDGERESALSPNANLPSAAGGLTSDGSLKVTGPRALFDGRSTWTQTSGLLLTFGQQGQLSVDEYMSDDQFFAVNGWQAAPGYSSALSFDPAGRMLLASQLVGGDLGVLRLHAGQLEAFRFLREEYADLWLGPTAMDAAGSYYLSTTTGGRLETDKTSLLCRIPSSAAATCFALQIPTSALLATSANVVFQLSGNTLSRFDLPPP